MDYGFSHLILLGLCLIPEPVELRRDGSPGRSATRKICVRKCESGCPVEDPNYNACLGECLKECGPEWTAWEIFTVVILGGILLLLLLYWSWRIITKCRANQEEARIAKNMTEL